MKKAGNFLPAIKLQTKSGTYVLAFLLYSAIFLFI